MKKSKAVLLFPSLLLFLFFLASWGKTGHRIVSLKAALSYNQEMKHFWDWTAYLTSHSADADIRRNSFPNEVPFHYIDLDNYPEFKINGKISKSYAEVVKKHGEKFVLKQGVLPWATLSILDSLTHCFTIKDFEKAAYFAADLGHFVADGHMPFHISANYDGQLTGNKGIHNRYETVMINCFENKIDFSGKPAVFIDQPEDFIFNYIYKNFQYVDSVVLADNKAQKIAGNSSSKLYTETLWAETGDYTNMFFEEASFAFSSLLYTAWVNGGSPKIQKGKSFLLAETEDQIWQVNKKGFLKKSVQIVYSNELKKSCKIKVYNKSGNLIEVLIDSSKNTKPFQINWKPENKRKDTYFITLKSGSSFYVRKVML